MNVHDYKFVGLSRSESSKVHTVKFAFRMWSLTGPGLFQKLDTNPDKKYISYPQTPVFRLP
jgi:hypothetical protein